MTRTEFFQLIVMLYLVVIAFEMIMLVDVIKELNFRAKEIDKKLEKSNEKETNTRTT